MSATAALRSKRQYYGQDRKWEGNYLSQFNENSHNDIFNTSMNNLKNADHFKTILFSAFIKKFNKSVLLHIFYPSIFGRQLKYNVFLFFPRLGSTSKPTEFSLLQNRLCINWKALNSRT